MTIDVISWFSICYGNSQKPSKRLLRRQIFLPEMHTSLGFPRFPYNHQKSFAETDFLAPDTFAISWFSICVTHKKRTSKPLRILLTTMISSFSVCVTVTFRRLRQILGRCSWP
ncbi:hypothetical protein CEXT_486161 [Caerostris extrusa]|uniref:Uncharacterized protein n=1 Tax=Caerostris extrusa TaxID=172846 RepID=A0AAV4N346_CAEEX|nr:hypothetical protein CEXT_486161 [Caerostris extrusa]